MEGEELAELQILHDCTYQLTQRFYEHGDTTFRQLLMHHGPLPEKEEDIQVLALSLSRLLEMGAVQIQKHNVLVKHNVLGKGQNRRKVPNDTDTLASHSVSLFAEKSWEIQSC